MIYTVQVPLFGEDLRTRMSPMRIGLDVDFKSEEEAPAFASAFLRSIPAVINDAYSSDARTETVPA